MKSYCIFTPQQAGAILIATMITLSVEATLATEALVVSLKSIPDRVSKQNPSLAAARYRIAEAQGRHHQSGRRNNPELELDFAHNGYFNEGEINIGITQRFPVTNRLALEKAVVKRRR